MAIIRAWFGYGFPPSGPCGWRFPELELLCGDRGAKALLGDAKLIPFPGGEIDVGTPEDVEAWLRR